MINSTCSDNRSSQSTTPISSCHTPLLEGHSLYIPYQSDPRTELNRPPKSKTPPPPAAKLFSRIIDDLANIFVLPHQQPLVNEEIIRQLPPGHPLRPFYLDVVTGIDNVPLLSMSEEEHNTGVGASPETPGRGGRRKANARARVEDLGDSIPGGSLPGGKTFDQLPLYEKKSVLINRELDDMGMGRYQWCIFFLCGFGYFLDLCWAQAFGLVATPLSNELGIPEGRIGDLSTAFNTGLTIGAFTWGLLVDILGRKWCFNITCIFASVFGFLFAAPSNFPVLCFFASMIGFGVGGNIPIDATITIEALPRNRRYLLAALSTFQPLGTVSATLVAYGLIPSNSCAAGLPACSTGQIPCCTKSSNMGWRYTMITLGCVTLFIFICRFVIFTFRESPKFLLAKGHDAHALDVLYSIAKFNRVAQPKLSMDDFNALDYEDRSKQSRMSSDSGSDADSRTGMLGNASASNVITHFFHLTFGHLKKLFADKMYAYVFIVLAIAYMSYFWSFSVAGFFLPILLAQQGVDQGQSVEQTYRNYIWIYLPGITATVVAAGLMEIPRVGRKWGMVTSSALMGVALALYQLVDSIPASVGFNAMEYWFQSVYGALLYAFTPESFPAPVRGSASGMLSTLGRIASIVAPIAAGHLYSGEGKSPGILFLAAGAAWVSTIAILCLPIATKGKQAY